MPWLAHSLKKNWWKLSIFYVNFLPWGMEPFSRSRYGTLLVHTVSCTIYEDNSFLYFLVYTSSRFYLPRFLLLLKYSMLSVYVGVDQETLYVHRNVQPNISIWQFRCTSSEVNGVCKSCYKEFISKEIVRGKCAYS